MTGSSNRPAAVTDVPIIDIASLDTDAEALAALDFACRDWGFCQIVGHGVDPSIRGALLRESHTFFEQTGAVKNQVARSAENVWGYYDRELTKNVRDWKEIFDVGPAEITGPLAGATPQWPDNPAFKTALDAFVTAARGLSHRLLRGISSNLGMPPGHLDRAFAGGDTSFLRLNYYPPCPTPAPSNAATDPDAGHFGIHDHTDAGALTVLLQDEQAGLQVQRNNQWHTVTPQADALVVNIGDIVQVWSNDRYTAPLHRVFANSVNERLSAAYFFNPSYATDYAPLAGVCHNSTPRYRPINWGEFRAARAAGDYADYGREVQIGQFRL